MEINTKKATTAILVFCSAVCRLTTIKAAFWRSDYHNTMWVEYMWENTFWMHYMQCFHMSTHKPYRIKKTMTHHCISVAHRTNRCKDIPVSGLNTALSHLYLPEWLCLTWRNPSAIVWQMTKLSHRENTDEWEE